MDPFSRHFCYLVIIRVILRFYATMITLLYTYGDEERNELEKIFEIWHRRRCLLGGESEAKGKGKIDWMGGHNCTC